MPRPVTCCMFLAMRPRRDAADSPVAPASGRTGVVCACLLALTLASAGAGTASDSGLAGTRLVGAGPAVSVPDGWKFHPGDDPVWAMPDFDDSEWSTVNSAFRLRRLPAPPPGWEGIGWFRIWLSADADAAARPVGVWLRQSGASELYVDGRRVHAYGTVGRDYESERAYLHSGVDWGAHTIALDMTPGTRLLAIRYSNFTAARHRHLHDAGFTLSVGDLPAMTQEAQRRTRVASATQVGFTVAGLVFAALHLALFLFYPRIRQNLYFAGATTCGAAVTFLDYQQQRVHDMHAHLALFASLRVVLPIYVCGALLFTYSIFRQHPPRFFRWYAAVCGLTAVAAAVAPVVSFLWVNIVTMAAFVETARVVVLAVMRRSSGAWIVGAGYVALVCTAAYDILLDLELFSPIAGVHNAYPYGGVGLLVSMSAYMARRFALTNHELTALNTDLEGRVTQRTAELAQANDELDARNEFIRGVFGRYLTDEIVESLLESPEKLQVGGERRTVTILMADIRGSTPLTEGLPAEDVMRLLNTFLAHMTDVIMQHEGTIDEFIGDAIMVLFGAPVWKEDHADRALACAIAMQNRMAAVNAENAENGLPPVRMGVGVNTGPVVVGNIGSARRAKYGVVGIDVVLTARIQAHAEAGQILASDAAARACASEVDTASSRQVPMKGVTEPVTLHELAGIGAPYGLRLGETGR